MEQTELYCLFTHPLDSAGIRYMATGSVASIAYGVPRLTHDLDLVVELDASQAELLTELFPQDDFYCPPVEVVFSEARRKHRGHFNLLHHETGFKADVYLHAGDPFQAWAFEERRRVELDDGKALWVAPPEYVIVRKAEWYEEGGSGKHISDIRGMLETNPDLVRADVLQHWLTERKRMEVWIRMGFNSPNT